MTLEQMEEVLHFPDQKMLHPAVSHLIGQLNDGGGKGKYQLVTANAFIATPKVYELRAEVTRSVEGPTVREGAQSSAG